MIKLRTAYILSALITPLLSACETAQHLSYRVSVDSLATAAAPALKKYVMAPGDASIAADDLQYQSFSNLVDVGLKAQGFVQANTPADADILVLLSYGISGPISIDTSYVMPTFGQTGVASAMTTGNVGGGNFSAMTTYTPSYGVTGYVPINQTSVVFDRRVLVGAYATKDRKQVWKTLILSRGSSSDLRMVMPYMIRAATPYFGKDTGHRVDITLPADPPPATK